MALNIKNSETERLAAEVARLSGESKTGAITTALRERRQRLFDPRQLRPVAVALQEPGADELMQAISAAETVAVGAPTLNGKGRHPAALNFGDCLAYATATIAELPLLARGGDFAQTDLSLV